MEDRTLQSEKNWNVDDFIGKNHLVRIDKNQAVPIPGTQIRKEQGTHAILISFCIRNFNKSSLPLDFYIIYRIRLRRISIFL